MTSLSKLVAMATQKISLILEYAYYMRISFKILAVLHRIVNDHFGGGRRRKPGNEAIGKPSICNWTGI